MSGNTVNRGCLIALSLFSIVHNAEIDIKAAKTVEPILADVMKNITRVNTMLQDLIKNYEKLEKLSKLESVESDYTDTEVDELFNDKKNKKNRAIRKSTPTAKTHKAFATAMFFDEHDPNEGSASNDTDADTKTDDESTEASIEKDHKVKENQQPKKNQNAREQHSAEKQQENKKNYSNVQNKAKESVIPAIEALKDFMKTFSDEEEVSGEAKPKNDSNASTNSFTAPTTTTNILPGIIKSTPKIQPLPKEKKYLEPRLENYEMPAIVRSVRKHNDEEKILIGKAEKKSKAERKKEEKSNTTDVDVPKEKKNQPDKILSTDIESSEQSKIIKKEELRANVLRKAYGDACLKVVVRKCLKACQATVKEVCKKRSGCPKGFKDKFKKKAIKGCEQQFGRNVNKTRMSRGRDKEDEGFHDATRAGYLSMACFPAQRMPAEKPAESKPGVTIDSMDKTLNILRDKYEMACQEESMRKCYKACTSAVKEACADSKCSKRKLKYFNNTCKKKCKESYSPGVSKESDSSSSGSSEKSAKSEEKSWESN